MTLPDLLDAPVGEALNWPAIWANVPWAEAMGDCIQDPEFHAEGDVKLHTQMVIEAAREHPEMAEMSSFRRRAILLAALLHDVAKPLTRAVEPWPARGFDRVTHKGHSLKGATMAWGLLWRLGVDVPTRERVFALCAWHQRVFHLLSQADPREQLIRFSQLAPWHDLIVLAEADNRGRTSVHCPKTETELEIVRLYAEEQGVLDSPWDFSNDEARVIFGRETGKSAYYDPPMPAGSRVILLSGLPGSGKDTYAARALAGLPQISLDALREEESEEGTVIQLAKEKAREFLRRKEPFVWNATTTTKMLRDRFIALARSYDAHVSIHALDTPYKRVMLQNRERKACVPMAVMQRFIEKWEPPTPLEAHEVLWIGPDYKPQRAFASVHDGATAAWQP